MTNPSVPKTVAEVEEKLSKIRGKRGYLLPHHGLLAVSSPELLDAYDATYSALTLSERVMTLHQKEIVWLVILVSTGEAIATHHIDRLRKGGGGEADVDAALAFSAWADGADRHAFVEKHWAPHLDGFNGTRAYRNGLDALMARFPVERWVVEVGLAAAHQCHRRWDWVAEHIIGAYEAGADEGALAEGLSLAMFPGGVPNFVDACDIWKDLILEGKVQASAPYEAWARMTGQGGFDEASGAT
ncbi:MAG: hypothetical protein JXR14_07460 [Paracoccaceae bacterium]